MGSGLWRACSGGHPGAKKCIITQGYNAWLLASAVSAETCFLFFFLIPECKIALFRESADQEVVVVRDHARGKHFVP